MACGMVFNFTLYLTTQMSITWCHHWTHQKHQRLLWTVWSDAVQKHSIPEEALTLSTGWFQRAGASAFDHFRFMPYDPMMSYGKQGWEMLAVRLGVWLGVLESGLSLPLTPHLSIAHDVLSDCYHVLSVLEELLGVQHDHMLIKQIHANSGAEESWANVAYHTA